MSRWRQSDECGVVGFPRVSGDEPLTTAMPAGMIEFSPRERG